VENRGDTSSPKRSTRWRGRALVGWWPGRPVLAAIRAIARGSNFKCDIEDVI